MSYTRNRIMFVAGLLLLGAQAVFAGYPSARTQARMAYDPSTTHTVLFGGVTANDSGTKTSYELNDTWVWTGERWIQRFPASAPPGRSAHAIAYDTNRDQIVVYGGKSGRDNELNDTWAWDGENWSRIEGGNAPPHRSLMGFAYDTKRERFIVFGGTQTAADKKSTVQLTDTWEFDGTNWRQTGADGPSLLKPTLAYDAARDRTILLGLTEKAESRMYGYDPSNGSWTRIEPAAMPACVNESALAYQEHNQTILLVGGVCNDSDVKETSFEWNGETWNKVEFETSITRTLGHTMAYDAARKIALVYGGTMAFSDSTASTVGLDENHKWISYDIFVGTPAPRSLFVFEQDPVNKVVWLYGGISSEDTVLRDLWKLENGQWSLVKIDGQPESCVGPVGAWDTARQRLVIVCATSEVYEFSGSEWKKFTDLKPKPISRRWSAAAYDENSKRVVLYGGFDETNFRNESWLWDGAKWTEVKKGKAPARSLTSMWWDPASRKLLLFGGVGRPNSQDRLVRYNDMWSFDATKGWTQIKPTTLPGARYGAQVAVNPRTNKTILFGGLRLDIDPTTKIQSQSYANDVFEWDGTNWRKVDGQNVPTARENGGFEYDPSLDRMVIFGGWAGIYLSDLWIHDDVQGWSVKPEDLPSASVSRRRSIR